MFGYAVPVDSERESVRSTANGDSVGRPRTAIRSIDRLNGTWYTDEQGGVYRPPAGEIVAALENDPACHGPGQSSWGPCVYAVTHADHADAARAAGRAALDGVGIDGTVSVVSARNAGAEVEPAATPRADDE